MIGGRYTDSRRHHPSPRRQTTSWSSRPYNAQVRCLREQLDARGLTDVPVGTVDKFQGQEAAVVFFSMATSSGEEIPRNVEFLYSPQPAQRRRLAGPLPRRARLQPATC